MANQPEADDGIPVEKVAQTMRGMLDALHAQQIAQADSFARLAIEVVKRECGEDLLAKDPNAQQMLADHFCKWADETHKKARVAAIEKFGIEI